MIIEFHKTAGAITQILGKVERISFIEDENGNYIAIETRGNLGTVIAKEGIVKIRTEYGTEIGTYRIIKGK